MDLGKFLFGDAPSDKETMELGNRARQARNDSIEAIFKGAANNLAGQDLENYVGAYDQVANQAANDYATALKQKEYAGGGMFGAIVNPYAQVADVIGDVATGRFGDRYSREDARLKNVGGAMNQWEGDRKQNNLLSDIGAFGEAGFDALGWGSLGNAVKGGATLGANIGKTALRQGGLAAGENAFAALREGGDKTSLGDFMGSAALGGTIGAGIGALSQLGGNAANMAKNLRSPQTKQMANAYSDFLTKKNSAIQDTARLLGDGAGGATIGTKGTYYMPQQLKTAMARMDTPLAKTGLGRVAQGIADSNAIYGSPLSKIANSKLGKTTKNILSTKTGKIGAGVGGGLLIAKLLSGGGNNTADNELSDAELEALLTNYYNNGGY